RRGPRPEPERGGPDPRPRARHLAARLPRRGTRKGPRGPSMSAPARRAVASVAAAPAPAAAARAAGRRHQTAARAPEPEQREQAGHLSAGALGTGDRLVALDQALERAAARATAILVDRHASRLLLLAAPLDVALHELLGVLLQDVVDLVEELVEVLLDLLALLRHLGVGCAALGLPVVLRPLHLLLLLVGHVGSPLHFGQHDTLL